MKKSFIFARKTEWMVYILHRYIPGGNQNLLKPRLSDSMGQNQFQKGETPDMPWFDGIFRELWRKTPEHQYARSPHYFTVALLQFRNEGVFKYNITLLYG